jgi:uncharacterized protein (DUF1499 family)
MVIVMNDQAKLPTWAVVAAVLGCVVLLASALAGFGARWGWWHFRTGFTILRWAAYASVAIALLSVFALAGRRAWPLALFGLLASLLLIGNGWRTMRKATSVPPIHDITTDTDDPPEFVAVLALRAEAANPSEYGGPEIARQQKEAYPDIAPLLVRGPADSVFARALAAAEDMGWTIVAAERAEGRIEATAQTFWFGFKDDVVVRLTPASGGTLVNVRSVSRVGRGDVGTNAARVREYLDKLRG